MGQGARVSLKLEGVSFSRGGFCLSDVELETRPGEVLGLVGPNGSGKTTLLRLMAGTLVPQAGRVLLDGRPIQSYSARQRARRVAVLSQEHPLAFAFTVREVVAWGRLPHRGRWQPWRSGDAHAVERALAWTELTVLADRPVQALSGGERQRVFVALALAQQPGHLLLDEPTAHLDLKHQLAAMALIKRLADEGTGIVVALHDLNLAGRHVDRLALLHAGRVVALGDPTDVLTPARIAEVWGVCARVTAKSGKVEVVPQGLAQAHAKSVSHG